MRLLALAPWFAALIASAGATKPEPVEEAGTYRFFFYDLFRFVAPGFMLHVPMSVSKSTCLMKRSGDSAYALPNAADVPLTGRNEPSVPLATNCVPRVIGSP